MKHLIHTSALLCVLALLAWQQTPINAEPKEGDWKSGWNTWEKAAEGDWVQYAIGDSGVGLKQEIKKVSGDQVTYVHKTLMNGKESSSKERTKSWREIRMQGKLPYGKEDTVEWDEGAVELSGQNLDCTIARWTLGGVVAEIWYCTQVPCGGIVKTTSGGKDSVWLTDFKSSLEGNAGGNGDSAEISDTEMPKFYATKGNYAVYQISASGKSSFVRHEITKVAKDSASWTSVECNKAGDPELNAKAEEHELTKEDWDAAHEKPKQTEQDLETEAGKFTCDVYESTDEDGTKTTEYISEGLVVMKTVKAGRSSVTYLLVKHEMK